MTLSSAEKKFVEKRERRAKYWPYFGAASLVLVAAYGAWLWVTMPHLIRPWRVIESLEAGTLSESTMGVMAVMLPFVMAMLLVFAFIIVLLWFVAFYNERRLIRLVRKMEALSVGGKTNGASEISVTLSNQE
jgi:HAMP domain-containing protein